MKRIEPGAIVEVVKIHPNDSYYKPVGFLDPRDQVRVGDRFINIDLTDDDMEGSGYLSGAVKRIKGFRGKRNPFFYAVKVKVVKK